MDTEHDLYPALSTPLHVGSWIGELPAANQAAFANAFLDGIEIDGDEADAYWKDVERRALIRVKTSVKELRNTVRARAAVEDNEEAKEIAERTERREGRSLTYSELRSTLLTVGEDVDHLKYESDSDEEEEEQDKKRARKGK